MGTSLSVAPELLSLSLKMRERERDVQLDGNAQTMPSGGAPATTGKPAHARKTGRTQRALSGYGSGCARVGCVGWWCVCVCVGKRERSFTRQQVRRGSSDVVAFTCSFPFDTGFRRVR